MNNIKIRRAAETDIAAITGLLRYMSGYHAAGRPDIFVDGAAKINQARLSAMIHEASSPLFVAVDEDDFCIGYMISCLKINEKSDIRKEYKTLWIDDLCVNEAYRSRGVGSMLLDAAAEAARELECVAIELNVWEFNRSAIRFYETHGYETQRRIMELRL